MMTTFLPLLLVALSAYIRLTDASCSYTEDPGYLSGYDIKSYNDISLDGCKHECDMEPKCKSFHYRTRLCYLKYKAFPPNRYLYKTYQFYRMFTKTPDGCQGTSITPRCQFSQETGNCNGRDIRYFYRMTLDGCKIECSNRLDCVSFHYTKSKICYLKSHVCTSAQLSAKGNPTTNQYVKSSNCEAYPGFTCEYSERKAAHCSGHVMQTLYKISVKTCQAQCNNKFDCKGISYRTSDEICWIQNYACAENQLIYKGNQIYNHYTKGACRKGSPVHCQFKRRTGECRYFDLVTLSGTSLQACEMECTLRPVCKSLQWRSNSCYLKSHLCKQDELVHTDLRMYMEFDKPESCNSGKKCSFSQQYAYCASGTALKTLSRVTLGACYTECSLLRRCAGFNYRTKTCWLQSTVCTGAKLLYKGNKYYKYYTKDDRSCSKPPEKQCPFTFQSYGSCNGHDIRSYAKVSLDFCKKECSDMPDCISFHYNYVRYCYLKNYICKTNQIASRTNKLYAQYSKPESCFPRIEKDCKYAKRHPAHCSGHVIQTLYKVEIPTCRTECNNEPDCLGFSYRMSDQICWLQNYACKENQLVYKTNKDYYHFTKDDCHRGTGVSCKYKRTYSDCQGHDLITLTAVSIATCEMECSLRGSCKSFVWYGEKCYLKDYICPVKEYWKGRTGNRYYKTFIKQGDCGQGEKCAFSLRYGNCPGYVIKTLTRTTLEACYTECSAVRRCQGFQYRTNNCWLQSYRCDDTKLQYKGNRLYKQYSKKNIDCSASPVKSCKFPKTYGNCNGHDIRSYAQVSIQFCKTACTNTIDCLAFHYNYARTCYMKNYICTDAQLAAKTNPLTDNYVKPYSCGPGLGLVCQYTMRHADCPGRQIKYLAKINQKTCETECSNNRDCAAFQYRIGNCWLKNYDCKENQLTQKNDNNYHLYTKGKCSPATNDVCEYTRVSGECLSRNIKTLSVVSLPTCKMECAKLAECKTFQYRVTTCWLKAAKCTDSKLRYKGNRYYNQFRKSGTCKVDRGPVCKFKRRFGLCNGHDVRSYTDISLTACLDQCSMNKQCLSVQYRTRTCWLKNYVCSDAQLLYKTRKLYKQYDKLNPSCGTPPGDVCQFSTEQGMCSGHGIKVHYYISIEACRTDCSRRIDCLSFYFNHAAKHCYLKNYVCKTSQLASKTYAPYNQNVKSPSCKILPRSRDYPSVTCNYRARRKAYCSGYVIQTIMKVEPETCRTECDLKIDCQGYSYRWSDQACWLQNYACKDSQLLYKGNKQYDNYVKLDCKKGSDVKCQFRRSFGTCGHFSYNWRIGTMSNVSPASCMQECSQRPECNNFQMRKNVCYLSDYNCRQSEMTGVGNPLQNDFVKTGQCTKGTMCSYTIRYGNCPGQIIKTLTVISLESCKAECSRRHNCHGFQYRTKICWFQNYVCDDSKLQYRGNRLYKQYTKTDRSCSIPPEKMCTFDFTLANCAGHNYRTYADVSLQTCKTACTLQLDCLGFRYTYTRYCYLKNYDCKDNQLSAKGTVGSSYYVKRNSCGPRKGFVCQYEHRNADCAGHALQTFTKVSLSTCRTQCNNNRDCLAFQYRVGYCYLKNYDCKDNQLSYKDNANYHLYTKKNTECPKLKVPVCEYDRVHGDCTKQMRNIQILYKVSLRTCQQECAKKRECRSFQFRTNNCWLKDRICPDSDLTQKGNRWYNQFRKTANCKQPQLAVCKYRRRYGYCAGHDIKTFSGITLRACQAECSVRKICLMVHYRSKVCYLKNYVCPDSKVSYKGNRLFKEYIKENKNCGRAPTKPCTFQTERGYCGGHQIGAYTGMSLIACQIECTHRVDCWSFHWYQPTKVCYLKNYICRTNQLVQKTNRYRNQYIKPDNCNPLGKVCQYTHEHSECAGHNLKAMNNVDLDTCRTQCNNDHDCLGFQYNTRRCYLKNYDCPSHVRRWKGDKNYNQYRKKSCKLGLGPVCPFTRQFGQCKGHALVTLTSVYLATCKMECSRREKCLSAYYQKPHCYLKTHVCSTTKLAYKGYRYMQQFTKASTCAPNEGATCNYGMRHGQCTGHALANIADVSLPTCRAQCAVTKACKGFQFITRYCALKNYDCSDKQLKNTNTMKYRLYSKQMPCHKSPAKICQFDKKKGLCAGRNLKTYRGLTLEACMAECTQRYNCLSIYHYNTLCYLKFYRCTDKQLVYKTSYSDRQYDRATTCGRVKGLLCNFKTRAGYCNSYNFKTWKKMSLQACQIECSNRVDCVSIMHAKSSGQCILKNNLCKDHEISLRSSTDYTVGVKGDNCKPAPIHKCSYTQILGNCAGHDLLVLRDVHMDTCLSQCSARDDCYTAVYYRKICYMKKYVCKPKAIRNKGDANYWLFTKEKRCVPPTPCKCRFNGDPHYYTFDGLRLDFMGHCKYTAAASTDDNDPCAFKVEVKQEYRGRSRAVSYVRIVDLKMLGHVIRLQKGNVVYADGKRVTLPAHNLFGHFDIKYSGGYMHATATKCKISINYNGNYMASLFVPGTFRGKLNGLCGNCNGNKGDDYVTKQGKKTKSVWAVGQSYEVPDDSDIPTKDCKKPEPKITCNPPLKSQVKTNKYCGYILDKKGPFGACIRSNKANHQKYYKGCRYDTCALGSNLDDAKQQSCRALAAFAAKCAGIGYRVRPWRTTNFCPKKCGAGQRYSQKANSCPNTCAHPVGNFICNKRPVEGCECKPGYVLAGTTCIPASNCKAKPGPPCLKKVDLMFVMDSSGSVGALNFKKMKGFMTSVVASLGRIGPGNVQVGVVRYSTGATEVIRLNQYKNSATLQRAIVNIPYVRGWTYTAKALHLTRVQAMASSHGRRGGSVNSMVIVLTDGSSTDKNNLGKEADDLRAHTKRIIAVGIGKGIKYAELELMAGGKGNVLTASSFGDLSNKIKSVLAKTCDCPIGFVVRNFKCVFSACPDGYQQRQDGNRMFCKKRKCKIGFIFRKGQCTYRACPASYIALVVNGKVISCWPNRGKTCPRGYHVVTLGGKKVCAKNHDPKCAAGSKLATVHGKRVCQVSTSGGCPRGSVEYFAGKKRVCYKHRPKKCAKGTTLATVGGKRVCYKGTGCPVGFSRRSGRCHFVRCPRGYVRRNNRCHKIPAKTCPPGTIQARVGFAHVCLKNGDHPCPKGSVRAVFGGKKVCYKWPSPFKCPARYFQVYHRCVRQQHKCPKGTTVVKLNGHHVCSKTGPKCPRGTVEGKAGTQSVCTRPGFVCPTGYRKEGMKCVRLVAPGHHCAGGTIRFAFRGRVYCIRGPAPGQKCHSGSKLVVLGGRKLCVKGPGKKGRCPRHTFKLVFGSKTYCLRGPTPKPGHCAAGLARVVWGGKTYCFRMPPPNHPCPAKTTRIKVGKNHVCVKKPATGGKCPKGTIAIRFGSRRFCVRGPATKPGHPVPTPKQKCSPGLLRISWMGTTYCINVPYHGKKCPANYVKTKMGKRILCARKPGRTGSCPQGTSAIVLGGNKYCLRRPGPAPEPPLTCPKDKIKLSLGGRTLCVHTPEPAKPCPKGTKKVNIQGRETCVKPPVAGKCPAGHLRLVFKHKTYCFALATPKPGTCPSGMLRIVFRGHKYCFNRPVPHQNCPAGQKKTKVKGHEVCMRTQVAGKKCPAGHVTLRWSGHLYCIKIPFGPGPSPSPIKISCPKGTKEHKFGDSVFCIPHPGKDGNCKAGTESFDFKGTSGCILPPGPSPQSKPKHCPKGMEQMGLGTDIFCVYTPSPGCKKGTKKFSFYGMDICASLPVGGKCQAGFRIFNLMGKNICVRNQLPAGTYCPKSGMELMKFSEVQYCVLKTVKGACPNGLNLLKFKNKYVCVQAPGKVPAVGCPPGSDGKVFGGTPFCTIFYTGQCPEGTEKMKFDGEVYCVINYAKETHRKLGMLVCPRNAKAHVEGGMMFCLGPLVNGKCPLGSKAITFGGQKYCFVTPGPGGTGAVGCPKNSMTAEIHEKEYCLLYAVGGRCPSGYFRDDYHGHLVCYKTSEFTCPAHHHFKNGVCEESKCPKDTTEGMYKGERMCFKKSSGACPHGYTKVTYRGQEVCYQSYVRFTIVCQNPSKTKLYNVGQTFEDQCVTYKCTTDGGQMIGQKCPGSDNSCHKPGSIFKCIYGDKCSCEVHDGYIDYTLPEA